MPRKKTNMQKETISFRGNRDKWLDFVYKCKKKKKQIWEILEPFIDKFLESD